MQKSHSGQCVLSFYQNNKRLDPKYRRLIASCVAEYLLQNQITASPKYFEKIAENIASYFTYESKVSDIEINNYYINCEHYILYKSGYILH